MYGEKHIFEGKTLHERREYEIKYFSGIYFWKYDLFGPAFNYGPIFMKREEAKII